MCGLNIGSLSPGQIMPIYMPERNFYQGVRNAEHKNRKTEASFQKTKDDIGNTCVGLGHGR
jgi:hypothetical protein